MISQLFPSDPVPFLAMDPRENFEKKNSAWFTLIEPSVCIPSSNYLTVIWKMFVQVARNQLIWTNWKTSYKHSNCISSSICPYSCKSRDKKHKRDRELVIECLDRTIKLIESSGVGSPSLSRQYRKDLESCLFKASIQICLSLLLSTQRENGQVRKTAQIADQVTKVGYCQYYSKNWRYRRVWRELRPKCQTS